MNTVLAQFIIEDIAKRYCTTPEAVKSDIEENEHTKDAFLLFILGMDAHGY